MTAPVVRYAPSPTGWLHLGNARPALLNWLFAQRQSAAYILRLDDTDTERSRIEFERAIDEDLSWLGIVPTKRVKQSERTALYDAARDKLIKLGRLYPAYETQEELDRRRKVQLSRGQPPIYDRAAMKLTAEKRAALEAEGRRPHWRFRLEGKRVKWDDLVLGP